MFFFQKQTRAREQNFISHKLILSVITNKMMVRKLLGLFMSE